MFVLTQLLPFLSYRADVDWTTVVYRVGRPRFDGRRLYGACNTNAGFVLLVSFYHSLDGSGTP
jgi:hypothetical protein